MYRLGVISHCLERIFKGWFSKPIEEMLTRRKNVYKILNSQLSQDNIPKPLRSQDIVTDTQFSASCLKL